MTIYVNRVFLVEYLHQSVFANGHSNILVDFLYTACRTLQFVAMSRANAIIDLRISKPIRWLAGKAAELQDWSPYKNNMVLDLVYEVFKRAQDDGNLLLDPDLRVFGSIEDEQPLFREWMVYTFCSDSLCDVA